MYKRWKARPELQGYAALVLHAHLPYIRHADREGVMEERWFYEAMTETYLPLLEVFARLARDGVDYRVALSMTPTLLALCADPLMQSRYAGHLERLIELADKETARLRDDDRLCPLAAMYAVRFRELKELYDGCGRNIAAAFRRLQDAGKLEIMTSAATHGYLPLMKTEEAIRAQIRTGIREYERHFGCRPKGFWLPECGYTPGIDRLLKMEGIQYVIGDASAVEYASPAPNRKLLAPLLSPYGITVFPRDPESSEQVWSATDGYPGHVDYREYYRDIGWDLGWNDAEEWEYIRPYMLPTHERVNTGLKYYRITGNGKHREPYNPDWARKAAAEQADHFLRCRQRQAEAWRGRLDRLPLIVSPYDAELFGHWWYEGPVWIEMLCRKAYYDQHRVRLITPGDYLELYPVADTGRINESSWGRNRSSEVWLQPDNDWIYRHLHQAEERMIALATRYADAEQAEAAGVEAFQAKVSTAKDSLESGSVAEVMSGGGETPQAAERLPGGKEASGEAERLPGDGKAEREARRPEKTRQAERPSQLRRALNQAARELLLAQSSDWAFIMDSRTVVDYAVRRTKDHLGGFNSLCGMIEEGRIDERFLGALERRSSCFPELDYRDYRAVQPAPPALSIPHVRDRPNMFMLAWEYPPKYVGGLSRAVADLAEALAARGETVHVVTTSFEDAPAFELRNGVCVHRLPVLCSGDTDFYHWTFEMNAAMVDYLVSWKESGGRIDLLHAHDWMVFHAAREIKHSYGLPLVATIHATEWGRQQGRLHGELQRRIHGLEWRLTYEAKRVFVCSRHMKEEVVRLFELPADKVDIVPNGISVRGRTVPAGLAKTPDRPALHGNGGVGWFGADRARGPSETCERSVSSTSALSDAPGMSEAPSEAFGGRTTDEAGEAGARSNGYAPADRVILFVGRLVYEKGVQVLLEAMPLVLARVPEAKLVAAGTGPMRDELERKAAELGCGGRVSFLGFVDEGTKSRLYREAEICVFPSLYEPFGIVALEAMASRRPLVVSDVGGLADLVEHGRDGYKALVGHAESLAWHITELLLQPGVAADMAARAYEKALTKYDPFAIAGQVQGYYDRLMDRRRPDPETAVRTESEKARVPG